MAKIDRVEDLPEWFDLEKYSACEHFGALDWCECLMFRQDILWFTASTRDDAGTEFEPEPTDIHLWRMLMGGTVQTFTDALRELREAPLRRDLYGKLRNTKPHESHCQPVRDVSMWDLARQVRHDRDDVECGRKPSIASERWRIITSQDYMEDLVKAGDHEEIDRLALGDDDPLGSDSIAVVAVDLAAPNSVLTDSFAAWLEKERSRQPATAPSKRERPAYKDWARYGLLPYLDLIIWADETNTVIPHHVMAEAVGYRKGGDSFRKTVPKLAEQLINSLSELEALAAHEAASSAPASAEKLGA